MNFLTEKAYDLAPTGIFTLSDVLVWLGESRNSERNVLKRAVAAGEIIRIRRGLYCISSKVSHRGVSRNLLANLICGPSYVSMEAALSFHGWIPEAVHSMTSVGLSRPRSVVTPTGATYASGTLLFPFPSSVRIFDRGSSFSGKIHALLCRTYIKGRDWFDLTWYAGVRARVNHALLSAALNQQGVWAGQNVKTDDTWVRKELLAVVDRMDWDVARHDVLPFISMSDRPSVDLWDREFFTKIVEGLFKS